MSERDGYQPGVPCWVDTWQPDADRAIGFYTQLLGWEAHETPSPGPGQRHFMCTLRDRAVAAIGSPVPEGVPVAWGTYVWVDSADDTAARAAGAGGRVVIPPFDSLDGGRMAILADPAGAVLGVWQPGEHTGAQLVNEPGAWAMSLLTTPDPDGAKAFYGELFGWEADPFGDGGALFRLPGYVGGEPSQPVPRDVIAAMQPGDDAAWMIDFWVDDTDAAASTAAELGGNVVVPPFDTPISRDAVLADPHGAVFFVSKIRQSA
jgi:uncharacterized protein